jgi:hypothetical protein
MNCNLFCRKDKKRIIFSEKYLLFLFLIIKKFNIFITKIITQADLINKFDSNVNLSVTHILTVGNVFI